MAKQSPLQEVKERFGSKKELATQLCSKLEKVYVDETDEEFERRIRTASNKQLLRLHAAASEVESTFGGKAGLVDAIMKLRYVGKPDNQYRTKLEKQTITRLLDEHRQVAHAAATH